MHSPIEPFDQGWLRRPDGAEIFWETSGAPGGRPALYLHGGPGSGLGAGGYRRRFDPERHLVVGLDQRGCGRSRPWASEDTASLDALTTDVLVEDLEALREHLGVERWLVHGVSWGSTLALAYALDHPARGGRLADRGDGTDLPGGVGAVRGRGSHRCAARGARGGGVRPAAA